MKRRKKSQDYYSLSKQKMIGAAGLASTDTLFKVLFALNRLDAVEDMLKEQH